MEAIQGFIAFLRCEAQQAEERARSLRATAASIEAASALAKKKRKRNESKAAKRGHTGYTLFVQENYANQKGMNSKETMAMIGRQWSQISEQEKQAWQYRAEQLKHAESAASIEEEGLPEPPGAENEDWRSQKKPARKQSDKSDGESATV